MSVKLMISTRSFKKQKEIMYSKKEGELTMFDDVKKGEKLKKSIKSKINKRLKNKMSKLLSKKQMSKL